MTCTTCSGTGRIRLSEGEGCCCDACDRGKPWPLRVVIAGSRNVTDRRVLDAAITESGFVIGAVLSGACRGVDQMGEAWAAERGVKVHRFPADWERFGRAAGPARNAVMAANADALIALWDGESRGTKSMIDEARKRGLQVFVKEVSRGK